MTVRTKCHKGGSALKKKMLCALLAIALVAATGCSALTGTGGNDKTDGTASSTASALGDAAAFGKFTSPVDVHIGMSVDPTDKTLPSGDSAGNNQYTRYLKENYNINVIVDWTAANGNDYNQKVSLSIASGKIPDGMVVNDHTYMVKAAKSNLLYNITDPFKQYASTQVQMIMETTKGRAMENASYNGKMVSLPNITADTDGAHVMFIRQDWLDKLGLPVPKTLDDIEKVAKAFVSNKMAGDKTIGIAGPSKNSYPYCTFLRSSNNMGGFDPVFSALDAYPGYWVENSDKSVTYGSIAPNTKKALEVLAKWYKEGLIDPEIGTRDNVGDPINANQCGIFFGPWWSAGYGNGDSFKNDPKVNWQAYPVYTDDGKWNLHYKTTGTSYTLISKDASQDVVKAVLIMNNALVRDEAKFDTSVAIGWYPLRNVMAAADEVEYENAQLTKILKGDLKASDADDKDGLYKLMKKDASVVQKVVTTYENPLNAKDLSQSNFGDFQRMYSMLIGDRPFATLTPDKKVYSVTYNQTPTMESKWANLQKMEDETMLKIIVGSSPISSFDKFVSDWKAQGGTTITSEVKALAK